MDSLELEPDQVCVRQAFGQDLVVFRSRSGVARAVDPYCPHMGAHLGHGGVVSGEGIRCPFHGWTFDEKGACTEIPYCDSVPAKTSINYWPCIEENGVISLGVAVPALALPGPAALLPESDWTVANCLERPIKAKVEYVAEGAIDFNHLPQVHGAKQVSLGAIRADGELLELEGSARFGVEKRETRIQVRCHGLGCVVTTLTHPMFTGRTVLYAVPLDQSRIMLRAYCGILNGSVHSGAALTILHTLSTGLETDLQCDEVIWANREPSHQHRLCAADDNLIVYRRWARQFESEVQHQAATSSCGAR